MTLDDEDLEEGSWQVVGEEDDSQVDSVGGSEPGRSLSSPTVNFRLPEGFAQSLSPSMNVAVSKMLAPIREHMKAMLPDYDALIKNALEPYNELIQAQVASIVASLPTFTIPVIDFPAFKSVGDASAIKQIASQYSGDA